MRQATEGAAISIATGAGTQIQMLLDRSVNKMDYPEVVSVNSIN